LGGWAGRGRPAAGEPDLGDRTPSGFLHVRTPRALLAERGHLGLQVVEHEIELVPNITLGRMNRRFPRRQGEDQPSVAGVHGRKSQDVAKEGAVGRRVPAVDDHMRAEDHDLFSFFLAPVDSSFNHQEHEAH